MGVYIKGMKMPEDCFGCPMVSGYEIADEARTMYSTVRCRLTNTRRPVGEAIASDCPLVPVPPHGRLIDADALMENCMKEDTFLAEMLFRKLSNAPTIIWAEPFNSLSKPFNEAEDGE